jgi:ankyrin repeat protein
VQRQVSEGGTRHFAQQTSGSATSGPEFWNAALFKAAQDGDDAGLRQLLDAGAELGARDERGRTPVLISAVSGHAACVRFGLAPYQNTDCCVVVLFCAPADLFLTCRAPRSPLHCRALLAARADVRAGDNQGHTPLMGAAMSGHDSCLRIIMEAGAAIDAKTHNDNTPLLLASGAGHAACVRELLKAGAGVEVRNRNGCTPLLWAARGGCSDVIEALLDFGADFGARDVDGKTAVELAEARGHTACAALIRRASRAAGARR